MGKTQDLLNSFYDIDNVITVDIKMPDEEWASLMACEPRGGICNFNYTDPAPRFDWYKASSVTISGTKAPRQETFADVGIIKKSYCGSFSTTKPSLRLNFAKNIPENEDTIEGLIGVKSITLNNCKQDPSFIRQALGYELFRQAKVPYARSNFAKVIVNGVNMGVFVNLEQYKKQFLKHNFDDNDKGNLYELDAGDDLDEAVIKAGKISFEDGVTDNQKDLLVAAELIATGGLKGAKKVIDYDAFIKLFAMETLLKHRDGFTVNTNNTYLYNDVKAVKDPKHSDVKLKFIPCGLDQLLRPVKDFELGGQAILARLIREDPEGKADLFKAIKHFATTIFSKEHNDKVLKPYIDRLEALVASVGATPKDEISTLRHELSLVRSGAYQHLNELPTEAVTLLSRDQGLCIHAPKSSSTSEVQEVYFDHPGPSGLWHAAHSKHATDGGSSTVKFKSEASGSWLHADSKTEKFGVSGNDSDPGTEFVIEPTVSTFGKAPWIKTGYFKLKNKDTGKYVSMSDTGSAVSGKKVVALIDDAETATFFYFF